MRCNWSTQSTLPRQFENRKETGDKEMGHEGQLDNLLNDYCGYLACVFTGDGFHRASIRVFVRLAEELIDIGQTVVWMGLTAMLNLL